VQGCSIRSFFLSFLSTFFNTCCGDENLTKEQMKQGNSLSFLGKEEKFVSHHLIIMLQTLCCFVLLITPLITDGHSSKQSFPIFVSSTLTAEKEYHKASWFPLILRKAFLLENLAGLSTS
jgi:hypothetical protein